MQRHPLFHKFHPTYHWRWGYAWYSLTILGICPCQQAILLQLKQHNASSRENNFKQHIFKWNIHSWKYYILQYSVYNNSYNTISTTIFAIQAILWFLEIQTSKCTSTIFVNRLHAISPLHFDSITYTRLTDQVLEHIFYLIFYICVITYIRITPYLLNPTDTQAWTPIFRHELKLTYPF